MGRVSKKDRFQSEPITEAVREEVEKIIVEESPAEVETTTVPPTVTNGEIVNTLHVKVRREPSFESEVLEVLRKGDKVKVLEKGNDFWKVSTSVNNIAYISSEFIKEE